MPAQFVETSPLRILLPPHDELMLVKRDGSFRLKTYFRPQPLRDDRPRQPVHREAEVVKLPQMNIGADRASLEAGKKFFRLCLDNHPATNRVQRLLFGGALPAVLG